MQSAEASKPEAKSVDAAAPAQEAQPEAQSHSAEKKEVVGTQAPDSMMATASPPMNRDQIVAIPSACGLHIVVNRDRSSLTALLTARQLLKPDPKNAALWIVDGVLLQIGVTLASEVAGPDTSLRGKALLDAYREWEIEWAAKKNAWPPVQSTVFMSQAPRPDSPLQAQVWAYEPTGSLEVLGAQIANVSYSTVASDDLVLSLTAPYAAGHDPQKALNVFKSFFNSVNTAPKRVNIDVMTRSVDAESKLDPQCKRIHGEASPAGVPQSK